MLLADYQRAGSIPITALKITQLPNNTLSGIKAPPTGDAPPGSLGLRCGAGAPFSAGGQAALPDEQPQTEMFYDRSSACPPQPGSSTAARPRQGRLSASRAMAQAPP